MLTVEPVSARDRGFCHLLRSLWPTPCGGAECMSASMSLGLGSLGTGSRDRREDSRAESNRDVVPSTTIDVRTRPIPFNLCAGDGRFRTERRRCDDSSSSAPSCHPPRYSRTREHAGSTRQSHPTGPHPSAFLPREAHIPFEQVPAYAYSLSLALVAIALAHSHPNTTITTYDKPISQRGGQQAPYCVDAHRQRQGTIQLERAHGWTMSARASSSGHARPSRSRVLQS
ncbi:hypothetical protein C8Q76DRAFT_298346 [Earliella scabrosa]|nr:hypothetical protein C8Q76DRAFT_298346 [Earliella scabrosa]